MSDDGFNRQVYNTKNNADAQQASGAEQLKDAWKQAAQFPIANEYPNVWKVAVFAACESKTQLEAALAYAKYGIPVFPCNWKPNENGEVKKHPVRELGKGGLYLATVDPEQIQKWWKQFPNALIGGPMGRRVGVWALDVDSPESHAGDGIAAWDKLECEHGIASTRTHLTGTNGFHRLYLWNNTRPVGCPVSTVPGGMEVKGDGGYIILPPSPYQRYGQTVRYGVAIDDSPQRAPLWLYDLILGKRERAKSNGADTTSAGGYTWSPDFGPRKLNEFCAIVRSAQSGHWDEARRKVFKFGRWVGGGAMDVNIALEALDKAARQSNAPPDYPDEVKRALLNGVAQPEGPPAEGVSLDDFHAYMPQHTYIYIPTLEPWPASSVNARLPYGVPVFDKDGTPVLDKDGEQERVKSSVWLDQNRAVEQMTWAPGQEMLIRDRLISEGGWIERLGVTCFNLYRPPTIEPGDAARAGPWLEHVHKVFSDDDAAWIIKWCAQRVQHPEVKINHALVLGSEKQGTGKDTMLEPVKRAVGPWNFQEASPQQALGRFNGFLKSVILRLNEARDLGDINRYQFYEHTKVFTAAPPDVLLVDEKFLRAHNILNCVGVILTTNYKTNGIYLPADDRRHYVAWTHVTPADFADGYWNTLWRWYDAGGDRHVAAYLRGLDLSTFDPKGPPPKTPAFWDIVDANRAPEDAELADVLDKMGNPSAVTLMMVIRDAATDSFIKWLRDPKNSRAIPHRFEQCGYMPVRKPGVKQGLWIINGKRQVIYVLNHLSLRDQIVAAEELVLHSVMPSKQENIPF
jgi:hypothetical protein